MPLCQRVSTSWGPLFKVKDSLILKTPLHADNHLPKDTVLQPSKPTSSATPLWRTSNITSNYEAVSITQSETYNIVRCTENTGMCTMCWCHSVNRPTSHPALTVFWWYVIYSLRIFFLTTSIITTLCKLHVYHDLTTGLPTQCLFWHFIQSTRWERRIILYCTLGHMGGGNSCGEYTLMGVATTRAG